MARASGLEGLTTKFIARDISDTCNSFGSALWGSARNIEPLVDQNCHADVCHESPIRFSRIHYRSLGSRSPSSSGQAILFGCPLELCTVGELKKIPPVLEYLLESVSVERDWPIRYSDTYPVGQSTDIVSTNSVGC